MALPVLHYISSEYDDIISIYFYHASYVRGHAISLAQRAKRKLYDYIELNMIFYAISLDLH